MSDTELHPSAMQEMTDEELLRYSRHILLQDFGIEGQERLQRARALVVGAGGLGCPAALYLAASGVGHIVIVDDDTVDASNLQRQLAHTTADIGRTKVSSLADSMQAINPHIFVEPMVRRLQQEALQEQVAMADVVLDCTDNFHARLAINRACVMHRRPLVSGAAIRNAGQLAVFNLHINSPCYACLYGEQDDDENLTCSESGVFAPLVGIIGAMQAAEALKILSGYGESMDGYLMVIDVGTMEWRKLTLHKDPSCAVCGALSDGIRC
ncbi:MAG TPA: molybdopterin-synthase adenylyltransferase MoeB [Pseudomonadales bacterium]|nr:molybdopterin-synthase adenylyltransferase MoeB [Pseudomonadales bacterium]